MLGHYPECPLHRTGIGDVSTVRFVVRDEPLRDEDLALGVTGQPGPFFVVPYRAHHDVIVGHAFLLSPTDRSPLPEEAQPHLRPF